MNLLPTKIELLNTFIDSKWEKLRVFAARLHDAFGINVK